MYTLQNDNILVEIKSHGAELSRIYSKNLDIEYLWNGDKKHWGRHSPILFPIVGRLKDNETIIEGSTYNMSQHGFARDMEFDLLNITNTSASFILESNSNTLSIYPYMFSLIITYTIESNKVIVDWKVVNTDTKDIYFSIGAHPAFNLPLNNIGTLDDYYLELKHNSNVSKIDLCGPFSSNITQIGNIDKINLNADLFENDALIYTNIDKIAILNNLSNNYISLSFKNFPFVGIWTPYYSNSNTTAPFLCIEPWYGIADSIDTDKNYINKLGINKVSIAESFNCNYSIEVC